jgi:hypothetical protein
VRPTSRREIAWLRRARRVFGVLAATVCASTAVVAQTAPPSSGAKRETGPKPSVSVSWDVPPGTAGCIAVDELERAVETQVGRSLFSRPPSDVSVVVKIEQLKPSRWRALVSIRNAQGRVWGNREITSDQGNCRKLDSPLVLVLALMADSELLEAPPSETKPAAKPGPPPPPPKTDEPSQPEATGAPDADANPSPIVEPPSPPRRYNLDLEASGVMGIGVLPSASLGAELGGELSSPSFIGVRGHVVAYVPQKSDLASGGSIHFTVAYAGLGICPLRQEPSSMIVEACAGADVGFVHAKSEGLEGARSTTKRLWQATAAFRGLFAINDKWFVTASIGAVFALGPVSFVYQRNNGSTEEIHQQADLSLEGALGVARRIW